LPLRSAEFPPRSEIRRVLSPSYRTSAPEVVNVGLITPDVRQQMAAAWDRRFVPEGAVSLFRLQDCYVVGEGLVFDRTLALLRPSLTQHTPAEAEAGLAQLQRALDAGAVSTLPTGLLCCKRGAANYGHWLVEMLPMAHMGLRWQLPGHARFLVPAAPLATVVRDSMALLGVGEDRLHGCGPPVHVGELFVVTGLSAHGIALSPLALEALDAVAADIRPGPFRELWVSREGAPRRLLDESALCRELHRRGWAIAAPALFTVREQIALFKGARRIAGVCGAGLANVVFAPRGAAVTSFAPANMPDTLYWLLCELGGKRFREIRCPLQDGQRGIEPWDAPLLLALPEALAGVGCSATI
jgi:capsular polysaccharide biosynthesis protein